MTTKKSHRKYKIISDLPFATIQRYIQVNRKSVDLFLPQIVVYSPYNIFGLFTVAQYEIQVSATFPENKKWSRLDINKKEKYTVSEALNF